MADKNPDSEFGMTELMEMFKGDKSIIVGNQNTTSDVRFHLHTGSIQMDWAFTGYTHRGGYPSGRMVEIFGPEAVGKTTMVTHALIAAQRGDGCLIDWVEDGNGQFLPKVSQEKMLPGIAILVDSECKFPLDRAAKLGLDTRNISRISDEDATFTFESFVEKVCKMLTALMTVPKYAQGKAPIVIVLDSLAQTPIAAELEGDGLQNGIASKARSIRAAMRKMTSMISRANAIMLFTNHIYAKIGAGTRGGTDQSGGRGLKLASSLRLGLKAAYKEGPKMEGPGNVPTGIVTVVNTVKSSICAPPMPIVLPINWATGIDTDKELQHFFLEGDPCVYALVQSGPRLKLTMPDGREESFFTTRLKEGLDAVPGSREYLMSIFNRTMGGEKPPESEKKSRKKKDAPDPASAAAQEEDNPDG